MGTRLWLALLVCLGSASRAQALTIILSLPVTVTELSDWENNPYTPPNELAIGDTGTVTYRFDSEDLVLGPAGCSGCFGDVTMSVSPWSFQGSFPGATFSGLGGSPWGVLRISLADGAVDTLRIDGTEDDFSFHLLELVDPTGMAFGVADIASPASWLAGFSPGAFSQVSWRLETQPGATAEGSQVIPEPRALVLFGLAFVAILRRRWRGTYHSSGA
jgi:hypothetical protein